MMARVDDDDNFGVLFTKPAEVGVESAVVRGATSDDGTKASETNVDDAMAIMAMMEVACWIFMVEKRRPSCDGNPNGSIDNQVLC